MRLAQYSALWVEELSGEEGLVLPSCPPVEVTGGDGLSAERSASRYSGKAEVFDKWAVDDDLSRSVIVAMVAFCCTYSNRCAYSVSEIGL